VVTILLADCKQVNHLSI